MKKWILAGVLVLVVIVAAPYGVGVLTQQQWGEAVSRMNHDQPLVHVATDRYDRHFFGAELSGEMTVMDPETGEAHRIPYTGDVSHGVLSSSVELKPVPDSEPMLKTLFPKALPKLTLTTWLWGTLEADLNVPAIDLTDDDTGETLNSAEAYGWAKVTDAGDHVELNLNWPGMVVRSDAIRASFDNLQLSQEGDRVAGSLWSGDAALTVEKLAYVEGDQVDVSLENLQLTGNTQPEKDDTRVSSHSALTLDAVNVGDESYGPHRVEFNLDNLDVDAWLNFQSVATEIQMMQAQPDPTLSQQALFQKQMMLMQRFSNAAKAVAAGGLTVGMPTIDLKSADGDIQGHWSLTHPEVPKAKQADMPLIVQQLTGELELSAPVALLEEDPDVSRNLQGLVQQGILKRDGDVYRIKAKLDNMMLDINGQSYPLPPLI
ncbi:DUF945 domain-containing protein [Marinobacter sp. R17]|uniref:DUF945 family protein n=1 Tax=Marinobacter sp. R17 TaxID=2484250 RepID=UPI000F4C667F|nr:DUF945 family protein [Marinobacter sp. R17]ROT98887.1 DUF945 domain-containing protein [Marinobacter sp. R17]